MIKFQEIYEKLKIGLQDQNFFVSSKKELFFEHHDLNKRFRIDIEDDTEKFGVNLTKLFPKKCKRPGSSQRPPA